MKRYSVFVIACLIYLVSAVASITEYHTLQAARLEAGPASELVSGLITTGEISLLIGIVLLAVSIPLYFIAKNKQKQQLT